MEWIQVLHAYSLEALLLLLPPAVPRLAALLLGVQATPATPALLTSQAPAASALASAASSRAGSAACLLRFSRMSATSLSK